MKTTESVAIAVSAVAALVGIIAVAYSDDDAETKDSVGEKQGVKKQGIKELEARLNKRVTEISTTVSAVDASVKAAQVLAEQSTKNLEEIKVWVEGLQGKAITPEVVRRGEQLLDAGEEAAAAMRVHLENLETELLEKLTSQADEVCTDASRIREVLKKLSSKTKIDVHSDGFVVQMGANSVKYSPHGRGAAWSVSNDTDKTCSVMRPAADTKTAGEGT